MEVDAPSSVSCDLSRPRAVCIPGLARRWNLQSDGPCLLIKHMWTCRGMGKDGGLRTASLSLCIQAHTHTYTQQQTHLCAHMLRKHSSDPLETWRPCCRGSKEMQCQVMKSSGEVVLCYALTRVCFNQRVDRKHDTTTDTLVLTIQPPLCTFTPFLFSWTQTGCLDEPFSRKFGQEPIP